LDEALVAGEVNLAPIGRVGEQVCILAARVSTRALICNIEVGEPGGVLVAAS
jgi:hypothetical protein